MTTSLLFIQGAGPGAHDADRAIADTLQQALGDGIRLQFPRMPGEDDPEPEAWKRAIARHGAELAVAHSVGAALLADLLAEGTTLPHLRAAFLLAPPYVGEGGWDFDGYHLDARRSDPPDPPSSLFFYFGEADDTVPVGHAALFQRVFPHATFTRFARCGHQFDDHVPRVAQDVAATARALRLLR